MIKAFRRLLVETLDWIWYSQIFSFENYGSYQVDPKNYLVGRDGELEDEEIPGVGNYLWSAETGTFLF